jgi:hypothetical protein
MLGLHMVNLKGAIIGPRGVRYVAAMGYSSGGAMTYEFTTELFDRISKSQVNWAQSSFSAYIDAIKWSTEGKTSAETKRPPTTYHINHYQQNTGPSTGSIIPLNGEATVAVGAPIRTTINIFLDPPVNHYSIDNQADVQRRIREALESWGWK